MSRPHVALAIGALLVGVLGVYLFLEVRESPSAVAAVTAPDPKPRDDAAVEDRPAHAADPGKPPRSPWTAMSKRPEVKQHTDDPPEPDKPTKPQGMDLVKPTLDSNGDEKANPKGDAILDEVNRSYDHGDYDDAKTSAIKVLAKDPSNVRMIRVVVSSSCILGDNADAQKYYTQLTTQRDRDQMKTRCSRYGVTFTD